MDKTWVIVLVIALFLISTFVFWKITAGHRKKEYGKNMWKLWGARTFYWEGAIYICTWVTILIVLFLKWTNILTF